MTWAVGGFQLLSRRAAGQSEKMFTARAHKWLLTDEIERRTEHDRAYHHALH